MDFWVVAAATGAGYVAKHWQNLSGEKDNPSKLVSVSSPRVPSDPRQLFEKMPEPVFPLPKLARRCLLDEVVSSPEDKNSEVVKNLQDHNELPISGLAPIVIEKQVLQEDNYFINKESKHFDSSSYRLHDYRTKKTNGMKPLVLTNSRRLISRADDDLKTRPDDNKDYKKPREKLRFVEAKFFEPAGLVKLPRRHNETLGKRPFHSQGYDLVSLCIGITIGVLSTAVSNQREIEHLNELLENAENLVRDLHNELEKKDRLTDNHQMLGMCDLSTSSSNTVESPSNSEVDVSSKRINNPKAEKFELTSDIEAELEAELERLEENLDRSMLRSTSNVVEIDADLEADMAMGDLKLDAVDWQLDGLSNPDENGKSESHGEPVFSPNYAVSSLDLSLRLHEVIESGLRARIQELEALLHNTQSQPHSPTESNEDGSFWDFDHTRMGSFSPSP